ncbi:MAG: LysM peptidoglycan-binding domain-containing protein [Planctomycetes bacterium]|nr:LysM peptidoglycan-binding domain-containing protein [Planctomycetota bacterium]
MRTDVKIGLTLSLVVVVVAGWYYLRRSAREEAIPLAVELASSNPQPQGEPGADPADDALPADEASTLPVQATPPAETTARPTAADEEQNGGTGLEGMLAMGDAQYPAPNDEDPLRKLIERGRDTAGPVTPAEAEPPGPVETGGGSLPAVRSGAVSARRPIRNDETKATASNAKGRSSAAAPSSRIHRQEQAPAREHVVGGGDTFAILAEVYYGSQRHTGFLIAANPQVADPQRLLVGTVLKIPPLGSTLRTGNSTERSARQRRPSRPAARQAQAKATAKSVNDTYTVKSGDSFYSIAREVLADANRWPELFALNKDLVNGDAQRLRPGQVLKLPPAKASDGGGG